MAANSKIEWTTHTFNPWWGCTKVSPACDNCYAESQAKFFYPKEYVWGHNAPRRFLSDRHWREPHKWNRKAAESGERARVFCASMADVFEIRPDLDPHRERLWKLIEDTPSLDWQLLTKRPQSVKKLAPWMTWPSNVWLGTTVENQTFAEKRIHHLLESPAVVRFLSCEPLLGPVDLSPWIHHLHWIIAGGESGPGARQTNPDWIRSLRDQCGQAGVAFHFKQWGDWWPIEVGGSVTFSRLGKKHAGRKLDGRTWDELPTTSNPAPLAVGASDG